MFSFLIERFEGSCTDNTAWCNCQEMKHLCASVVESCTYSVILNQSALYTF